MRKPKPIPKFQNGVILKASQLNKIVDQLNKLTIRVLRAKKKN